MATDTRSSGMICSGQLHRLTFKLHDVQGIIKCCVYRYIYTSCHQTTA